MTDQCEYLLGDEVAMTGNGTRCSLPGVVTVRVDPVFTSGDEPVEVGTFCLEHAARMRHHVVREHTRSCRGSWSPECTCGAGEVTQ